MAASPPTLHAAPDALPAPRAPRLVVDPAATLRVTEVYASVQGESTWAGLPCTFIRLTGCPLRCVWCDTAYAFHGGEGRTIGDLVAEARRLAVPLVEVTGGEPLAQPRAPMLLRALVDAGFTVLLETSGALPIDAVPAEVCAIVDVKCPDSGEQARNDLRNLDWLTGRDEVKFVVASRRDFEFARDLVRERGLAGRCRAVLLSPVWGSVEPARLVEWTLAEGLHDVRVQLQLHKVIWGADTKGV